MSHASKSVTSSRTDYAEFLSRLAGPAILVDCPAFDEDEDGHIDLGDFAALQAVFGG